METSGTIHTQSVDESMSTMQQEIETTTEVSARGLKRSARAISPIPTENEYTSDNDDDVNDGDDDHTLQDIDYATKELNIASNQETLKEREACMETMRSLFATEPELERICKDWNNNFVDSNLTEYTFIHYTRDLCETNPDDSKYIINLKGSSLTKLSIFKSCSSSVMPLIKSNCPNLKELVITFDEIEDEDFENCFSNMPQLEVLIIRLKCKNSIVPMTLVKSLEQVSEILKTFTLSITPKQNELCSSDSSDSSDSSILGFPPSTEALTTVISNMKNIEKLMFYLDHGITDQFLINLVNTATKIRFLYFTGTDITDAGIKAINDAKELEYLSLECYEESANEFITDQSLECLFNKKMKYLNLANCDNVTDSGVITLLTNLPNLRTLYVENSEVTDEIREKIAELKNRGITKLILFDY